MLPCTALAAKITVEMSTRRITAAVSACSAGSKPGAIKTRTSQGENRAASAASAPVISTTQLVAALARRQAEVRSSAATNPVKTGMNAVASAPPATMLNNRSGSLNAA